MRFSYTIGLGVATCALVLELVLQCLPVKSGMRVTPADAEVMFGRYLPNQKYIYSAGWALGNAREGKTNAQGFSNSADFSANSKVLVLGDSFIECLMLDYPQTVQGQLDQLLHGGVYAAAFSGNGMADTLAMARYYVPKIHPRTVVMFVESGNLANLLAAAAPGHNAFGVEDGKVVINHNTYHESRAKSYVLHSALVRYIYYNLKFPAWLGEIGSPKKPAAVAVADMRRNDKEFVLDYFFSTLKNVSADSGTQILFLLDGDRNLIYANGRPAAPDWKNDDRGIFLAGARHYGFVVADMQKAFERDWAVHAERLDFLPADGHWNSVAHRLAAHEIVPLLAPEK